MSEYSLVTSDLVDSGRQFPAQTNTLVNGCNWVNNLVSCSRLHLLCFVTLFLKSVVFLSSHRRILVCASLLSVKGDVLKGTEASHSGIRAQVRVIVEVP